jgi:hypothetical protein
MDKKKYQQMRAVYKIVLAAALNHPWKIYWFTVIQSRGRDEMLVLYDGVVDYKDKIIVRTEERIHQYLNREVKFLYKSMAWQLE